jgi:hypothetical protein
MSQTQQTQNMTSELAGILDRLRKLQERMLGELDAKLEAMRRSDVNAMTAASHAEGELAGKVASLDERRCWLVVELCKSLGVQIPPKAQNVSLRSICAKLDEKTATRLSAAGSALREIMLKVAEANRIVELVCREMLAHFKTLFSAMTRDDEAPTTYSHRGAIEARGQVTVLDAVG